MADAGWRIGGVAVVTGAGRGNGAAIARLLAERGADVVVSDIDADAATAVAAEIVAAGGKATAQACDVSQEADVEALGDLVASRGQLRSWVNNAGIIDRRPILEIEIEHWDRQMEVNARGCFLGVRAAGRRMEAGGAIVNLASISSEVALPNTAHYGASKGAISLLTRHAALELGPRGIRVNSVGPGTIRTEMTEERLAVPEQLQRTLSRIPLGRVGVPEDVAGVVAFLCSEDAAFVNGAMVMVDGGWTAC
jgi:glucose 1-dehydrogenase